MNSGALCLLNSPSVFCSTPGEELFSASGSMDTEVGRQVEAARYRRKCFRVDCSFGCRAAVRRYDTEPDQPRRGGLRPSVRRRLLVPVGSRYVQSVVDRSAAGRRCTQPEVDVCDALPVVVARRRSGRRLVHRKRLRHGDRAPADSGGAL